MKQKIKIALLLITMACFPIGANAIYIESADTYRMNWSHTDDDGFSEFSRSKGSKKFFDKNIKWQAFHDKVFNIRHMDLKWQHLDDHWIHKLIEHLGWNFDKDTSVPPTSVPEPAALVLLATGILLIAGLRKSR